MSVRTLLHQTRWAAYLSKMTSFERRGSPSKSACATSVSAAAPLRAAESTRPPTRRGDGSIPRSNGVCRRRAGTSSGSRSPRSPTRRPSRPKGAGRRARTTGCSSSLRRFETYGQASRILDLEPLFQQGRVRLVFQANRPLLHSVQGTEEGDRRGANDNVPDSLALEGRQNPSRRVEVHLYPA